MEDGRGGSLFLTAGATGRSIRRNDRRGIGLFWACLFVSQGIHPSTFELNRFFLAFSSFESVDATSLDAFHFSNDAETNASVPRWHSGVHNRTLGKYLLADNITATSLRTVWQVKNADRNN